MNKPIIKFLIFTLILLIGISAVSAIEYNSTDEIASFEQIEENSISDNSSEINLNDNNEKFVAKDNNTEVLSTINEEISIILSNIYKNLLLGSI